MRVSVVALAALTALLTACTPPALVKLQEPLNEADKAEAVLLYLEQTEVAVDDVDVQQAGGGLIGVLIEGAIESTKTRNRQEALAPLRDVLLDYDYEAQLIPRDDALGVGPFDFNSIMLYDSWAFCNRDEEGDCICPTLTRKNSLSSLDSTLKTSATEKMIAATARTPTTTLRHVLFLAWVRPTNTAASMVSPR